MSFDRHAPEIEAIRRDVVSAAAVTDRADRGRVLAGESPVRLSAYLEKVRHASHRVTDEDVEELRRAGLREDEIYELTVAAAVGVAIDRLEAAKRALRASR